MEVGIRKPAKMEKTPRRKRQQDQLSGGMELFASPKRLKTDVLEVTGVSRSGRVRKKSSKLVDFESPDDLADSKLKRQQKAAQHLHAQQVLERFEAQQNRKIESPVINHGIVRNKKNYETPKQQRQQQQQPQQIQQQQQHNVSQEKNLQIETASSQSETEGQSDATTDSDDADDLNDDDRFSMDTASDEDIDPLSIDDKDPGFKRLEPTDQQQEIPSSQANSLYMLEKCRKKLIIKDGKIIRRIKAQRKDKGKTRFTAYMLWAKEVRQELIEQHPDMDFAGISKRLGELWSTVPNLEKYNWRRRAKRLATKPVPQTSIKDISTWKIPPPGARKKFPNKNGNVKEAKSPTKSPAKKTIQLGGTSIVGNISISPNRGSKDAGDSSVYKVSGRQPIDVAAHLKLLGESLTIIGERLKEHEGQIAVSGSLSVLLDSFLCALGPLLCLTQQVPEVNGAKTETLSGILDNIAYIMPGL